MPEIDINGFKVIFPFEPYPLQRTYMTKVIECLEHGYNGVLESPTGTGKTMSLICSTLAWVSAKKTEESILIERNVEQNAVKWTVPKVIYASRTHSQLRQAMQELQKTGYNHFQAGVIGSREHLCIHPDVVQEVGNSNKVHMCKVKVGKGKCIYHKNMAREKNTPQLRIRHPSILDIEDLVTIGRKLNCCPFFASHEIIASADIVFMPYNYLLDPKARRANRTKLSGAIIIFDEAHNVEKVCEDSASGQIASSEIAACIDDLNDILNTIGVSSAYPSTFSRYHVVELKNILLSLLKTMDDIKIGLGGNTFPGGYIFDLMDKVKLTGESSLFVTALLENLLQYLAAADEEHKLVARRGGDLQKLQDLLTILFFSASEDYKTRVSQCFKVHIESETKPKTVTSRQVKPNAKAKIISYWCFSPSFAMEQLMIQKPRCIILTSGTLAPLKPLISELAIPIKVRLENPHIVKRDQLCVKVVSQGPDNEFLLSNFTNRENPNYLNALGQTVLSFCPVIPHGLLIFFTSYSMLEKCRESWQESGVWTKLEQHKPIYIEPSSKETFSQTMNDYYASINDPITNGAIFMAVCRGKISEGLDFSDANGRAVIITGLPFAHLTDARVVLKKKYLQENRTRVNEMLSGDDWYHLEAMRAVNQAIGRVIRHKNDYGAILLCDLRFNHPRQKAKLSSWIQGHLNKQQPSTFEVLIEEVSQFFNNAKDKYIQPVNMANKSNNVITLEPEMDDLIRTNKHVTNINHLSRTSSAPSTSEENIDQTIDSTNISQPLVSIRKRQSAPHDICLLHLTCQKTQKK